jgi:predicted permease
MNSVSVVLSFIRSIFRRAPREADLEEEIRFHIEQETLEHVRRGMPMDAARQAAIRSFGGRLSVLESCRESWGWRLVDDALGDLAFGWKQVLKNKTGSLMIILTLAICFGAHTTASRLFEGIILDPYHFKDEDRIVRVGKMWTKVAGDTVNQTSIPDFLFIREHQDVFEAMAFIDNESRMDLEMGGQVERITVDRISPEVWPITGVDALAGRFFSDADIRSHNALVVVVGERLCRKLGLAVGDAPGMSLMLDGQSFLITGVAPDSFFLEQARAHAWIPRTFSEWEMKPDRRNDHSWNAIAKLKKGVGMEVAREQMRALYERYVLQYPEDQEEQQWAGTTFGVLDIRQSVSQQIPQVVMIFQTIRWFTAVVLAIGCLNVGGMVLVRNYGRLQEYGMRRALGASRVRLCRQIYAEIMLHFLAAILVSVAFIRLSYDACKWLRLDLIPWTFEWKVDVQSLWLTLASGFVCAAVTGVMPLVSLLRRPLLETLKTASRNASSSPARHRMHAFFVVSQVALSCLLLIATTLLARNLVAVMQKDVGFERKGRIALTVPQPMYRFGNTEADYYERILPFQEQLLERIRRESGVVCATVASRIPVSNSGSGHSDFEMEHYRFEEGEARPNALRVVTRPGYFETLGAPMIKGRDFNDGDRADSAGVVIISQNTMERYFPDCDPIGMRLRFWETDLTIVGVAPAIRDKPFFVTWEGYTLYFPYTQWPWMSRSHSTYLCHLEGDALAGMRRIEGVLKASDPNLVMDAVTLDEVYESAIFAHRIPVIITLFFASVAVLLSGFGLYGLVSFTVAERTREWGIRRVLGAPQSRIFAQVLMRSARLLLWGLLLGLGIGMLLCWMLKPHFPDIQVLAPGPLIMVLGFVFAIGMLSTLGPAVRAMRMNFLKILRYE